MLIMTTDVLPSKYKLISVLGIVSSESQMATDEGSSHQGHINDGIKGLINAARELDGANCLLGLRFTAAHAHHKNGSFIYYTYHATAVQIYNPEN